MLTTREIPIYENPPEDWQRFIYKAAKGSAHATNIVPYTDMAYMVALTNDSKAPETFEIEEYKNIFCEKFPTTPPSPSIDELIEIGSRNCWFPNSFVGKHNYINEESYYQNLWEKQINVPWSVLVNDSLLLCINNWSATHCLKCLDEDTLDYNSQKLVSAMLYLSLTWPST